MRVLAEVGAGGHAGDGFTCGAVHLVTVWIKTRAAIDDQDHRKRQLVLAKVSDLLLRSIFVNQEIFFLQAPDDARGILLQHQRIDFDQINIHLNYVGALWERRNSARIVFIVGRAIRVVSCRASAK